MSSTFVAIYRRNSITQHGTGEISNLRQKSYVGVFVKKLVRFALWVELGGVEDIDIPKSLENRN